MKTYNKTYLLLIFLILQSCYKLHAQEEDFIYTKINTKDGLANDLVYAITKDKYGFIWASTYDGLSRYDGYSFTNFYYDPKDPNSLSPCVDVKTNKAGDVWVVHQKGYSQYLSKENAFIKYKVSSTANVCYFEDKHGREYFYSYNPEEETIVIFDLASKKHKEIAIHSVVKNNKDAQKFVFQFIDQNATIWLTTSDKKKLYRCKIPNNNSTKLSIAENGILVKKYKAKSLLKVVHQKNRNDIWLVTEDGIETLDLQGNTIDKNKSLNAQWKSYANNTELKYIVADHTDKIFFGFSNHSHLENSWGILIYIPAEQKLKHLEQTRNNFIFKSIYIDEQNMLWAGTVRDGILLIKEANKQFHYPYTHPQNQSLKIFETDDSSYWFGTEKGIKEYQHKTGQLEELILNQKQPIKTKTDEAYLRIASIYKNERNAWVGTLTHGLFKFDHKLNLQKHYDLTNYTQFANMVRAIYEDEDGDLLFGTESGLWVLDTSADTLSGFLYDHNNPGGSAGKGIRTIVQDTTGTFWADGINGLTAFNKKEQSIGKFYPYENLDPRHRINIILTMKISSKHDVIWIGTMGGGLCAFDLHQKRFTKYYTTQDGLCNNIIYGILEDQNNNYWISTNKGISCFKPEEEAFINYNLADGLWIEEFIAGAALQSQNGELLFGGIGGIVKFHPDSLAENLPNEFAPLVITDFTVTNDTNKYQQQIFNTDTVSISFEHNHFQIKFASLDYYNASNINYEYQLKGVDKNWIRCNSKNRIASYNNILPGEYNFELRATNNTGKWNTEKTFLHIIVTPLYYQTWKFRLLASLFICAISLFIIRYSYKQFIAKQKQLENRLMQQKQEATLKALRAQMNPHFIFNALNSINNFIAMNDQRAANQYLIDFAKLTRLILEHSSQHEISLEEEIRTLKLYLQLEHLRFKDKFDYDIQLDININIASIKVPPLLIQPYIENAIWHGLRFREDKGNLWLHFYLKDNRLFCVIRDNGIGRKRSLELKKQYTQINQYTQANKSTGMQNVKERLDTINSVYNTKMQCNITDLYNDNEEATGTEVELIIDLAGNF